MIARLFALVFLLLSGGCASAQVITGGGFGGATSVCSSDGSSGAKPGTILYAARRATWAFPPPCQVPDVDYAVGPDSTVTLVSPAAGGALPAGASWDPTNHRVSCDGTNGLVIKNLDLSLAGGGGFNLANGCNNVTLQDIKITFNCASFPIGQDANSSGITIIRVTIDGGGTFPGANCPNSSGEEINLNGGGPKSITYSRVINAPQHSITFNCAQGIGTCTAVDKFNSFSRTGFDQGAHGNAAQFGNVYTQIDIDGNYYYNPQPDTALLAPLPATFASGSPIITVNVGSQSSFLVNSSITGTFLTGTLTILNSTDLGGGFTQLTLSGNATATGSGTISVPNAYPIGDTISVRYQADNSTSLLNGTISGNVFDGGGPIKGRTYAINASGGAPPNPCTTLAVNLNYNNPDGEVGSMFTNSGCTGITGAGNKQLTTGATIPVP